MLRLILWGTLLVAVTSGRAQSNLVANGSFEVYTKPPASWTAPGIGDYSIPPGSTNIQGWNIITAPIAYVRAWPAANGTSSIDLSGDGTAISGGVAQSITTQTGRQYTLSFHMSGNPGVSFPRDPSQKQMSVRIGGFQQVYTYDTAVEQNTFADMKWRRHELLYVANTNLTKIEFLNVMGTNLTGPVIDNVILQECIPPNLSIHQAGANVIVSWPDTVCPVLLESSAVVGPGSSWQTNSVATVHTGGRSFVTNGMSTNRFYRLKLQ